MKKEMEISSKTNPEKKIWLTPALMVISQTDVNAKSNNGAHEKSYQAIPGGKYSNPAHGTIIPKSAFTAYIS